MTGSYLSNQLIDLKPAGARLFLVGGAVRDILLQTPVKDYDLVCDFDTRVIARALADREHGDFYLLDAKRNTSRVILRTRENRKVLYDFARLQGGTIEADLLTRDFTINAMAFNLDLPETLIDTLGGARDLKDHVLRSCSSTAFIDDPVRVIRAIRYAVALDLTIAPDTLAGLKAVVPLLEKISHERNRDELLKALDTGRPGVSLRLLHRLGILNALEIGSSTADISQEARHCGAFEELISALEGLGTRETSQAMPMTSFLLRLSRFKEPLLDRLHQLNSSGRTLRTLDLLAAWISHYDDVFFSHALEVLSLSNEEKSHLMALYSHQNDLDSMGQPPDRRQIYRFFREAPVDLCLVWLAGLLSLPTTDRKPQTWLSALENCERFVDAWVNHPEILSPQPLLNGREIMHLFNLPPGKQVGHLLEAVIEEQAAGTVSSKDEAVNWLKTRLA